MQKMRASHLRTEDGKQFTSIKVLELRHRRCPVPTSLPFKKIELLPIFFKKKEPSSSIFIRALRNGELVIQMIK